MFEKTLALFTALINCGCPASALDPPTMKDERVCDGGDDSDLEDIGPPLDTRHPNSPSTCTGKPQLTFGRDSRPYLQ